MLTLYYYEIIINIPKLIRTSITRQTVETNFKLACESLEQIV